MIGWLDCGAGASGDMLLGALVDAGAPLGVLQEAVDAVGVEPVLLRAEPVRRGGLGALRVHVEVAGPAAVTRTWADVRALLEAADLQTAVRDLALAVFARLAAAEGAVHRMPAEQVHFHEVGALDAIADVVGACAGAHALGLTGPPAPTGPTPLTGRTAPTGPATGRTAPTGLTASAVAVGSGTTRGAHGPLPVPAPAVLALLAGAPVHAGPVPHESTTPTGAALLAELVSGWGPLPAMTVRRVGTGAGGRDPAAAANVLRLVLGDPPADQVDEAPGTALVLEANVDDLDPRVWPGVLAALLTAGAHDAWLTPVLMKKGRPAHVLSVLCPPAVAPAVRRTVLVETSTIGLRERAVTRTVLDRRDDVVDVLGRPVRVKRALLDGEVVNSSPEWDDVVAAALALGLPAKLVLAHAVAAAVRG